MPEDQPSSPEAEEECGWCKFMKAGPCRKVFEGWQACVDGVKDQVDEGGKGGNHAVVEHCAEVTAPLFECMAKHRYYYGSQLDGLASNSKERQQQREQGQTEVQQAQQQQPSTAGSDGTNGSSLNASGVQHVAANNSRGGTGASHVPGAGSRPTQSAASGGSGSSAAHAAQAAGLAAL